MLSSPYTVQLYQKSKMVFLLGGVFFNKNRTRELAYEGAYQTTADYTVFWNAFRKSPEGSWVVDRTWQARGQGQAR
jgi:hypothetical protein